LNFDLKELNCRNKDLDVNLDALGCNLDLFFHKTCLLAEFMCHLSKNHISLIWARFLLTFGRLIGHWVKSPKKFSLHQMDFYSSRYSSWNDWRSTSAECEIQLWRLWFPCSLLLLFFLPYMYSKVWMLVFFVSTSRAQALHKTSIIGQICQLSPIYFFFNLASKSAFKTLKKISRHFIYKT
jgi:hypothetical protein